MPDLFFLENLPEMFLAAFKSCLECIFVWKTLHIYTVYAVYMASTLSNSPWCDSL